MDRFTEGGTTVSSERDMDYSTRYDDRDLLQNRTNKEKLDWLSVKLHNEIMLSCESILKMERLRQQYLSDASLAHEDKNIGYEARYIEACERLDILIHAAYNQLDKVV